MTGQADETRWPTYISHSVCEAVKAGILTCDCNIVIVARHEVQHYTNQLAKDTNKYIKDLTALPTPSLTSEQVTWLVSLVTVL